MPKLNRFRPWFVAAGIYNAVWGAYVCLDPGGLFRLLGMPPLNYPAMFQCIGMLVGVYAPAYWLVAYDPVRYGPLAVVGLVGKLLGPIGLIFAALHGDLPWRFGWVNLTNDLIWLPAFSLFAVRWWQNERSQI